MSGYFKFYSWLAQPLFCIVTSDKKVLTCSDPNKHYCKNIIKEYSLKDSKLIDRSWVKIRIHPENKSSDMSFCTFDYTSNVDDWIFEVDEYVDEFNALPDWFVSNEAEYRNLCKDSARDWQKLCVDDLGQYIIKDLGDCKSWYKQGKLHREDGPAFEHKDGSKKWYINDQLHREDGPAVECLNGDRYWYVSGERHRLDGPAIEYAIGVKHWYVNGKYHREDGPAIEFLNADKEWRKNHKRHREDGPAVECASGRKEWLINDKRHREDGPAIEWPDGTKEYWIEGKQVKESDLGL